MRISVLAFAAGIAWQQWQPSLPSLPLLGGLATAAGRSLLLTSDIEARAEAALLARGRERLAADVLLVPHHGSRTSSTPEFVAAVGGREAIFPLGYRNRFGHPKAEVVARYEGVRQWRSDSDGAVSVQLGRGGINIEAERATRRRHWHGA